MVKLTGHRGKGMIVCASRVIAARLFEEIVRRRPDWEGKHDPKTGLLTDDTGRIRVVFTGNPAKDTLLGIADYVRTPTQIKDIQKRVTDADDELELVIVQSLWLTGFDAPPLHTLYLDKRMRGAALMQAIARARRRLPGRHPRDQGSPGRVLGAGPAAAHTRRRPGRSRQARTGEPPAPRRPPRRLRVAAHPQLG
jgi:type I restriction enzyme R subunit